MINKRTKLTQASKEQPSTIYFSSYKNIQNKKDRFEKDKI